MEMETSDPGPSTDRASLGDKPQTSGRNQTHFYKGSITPAISRRVPPIRLLRTEDRNSQKESSILPVNNVQEDPVISPVKNILVAAGKNDNAAEKQDTLKATEPDVLNNGVLPEHLPTSMNKLLIGISIALLCNFWNIWSLSSTISEENVESIIQRCIEDKYGLIFEESLKKEVDKFRSSGLKNLELDINTIKETVGHLDTTVQILETKHNDLHGLVGNTASDLNTLELNINTLKETVTNVDTATQELQTKHNELRGSIGTTASNLNDLELNINTIKETVTHVDTSIKELQTNHDDLSGLVGNTASNLNTLELNINSLKETVTQVDTCTTELQTNHDELRGLLGNTASNLNNLDLNINTFKETVAHMDTATKELRTDYDELHGLIENAKGNVKNLLSQEKDLKESMGHILNNLEYAENTIKTVQVEAIRTLDEKVTQVKSSTKDLNKSMSALNERVSAISDTSKETVNLFNQLKTDQHNIKNEHNLKMQEFTALKQNMESTKTYLNEKLEKAEESVTSLSISLNVVNSRLKQHQNLTDAVEFLQSKYEEKIEPNLFNKGHLLLAFLLLVLLVLIMMMSQYRLYQLIRGAQLVQGDRSQNHTERVSS